MIAHPLHLALLRCAASPGWSIRVLAEPSRAILGQKDSPLDLDAWLYALSREHGEDRFRVQALRDGLSRVAVTVAWYDEVEPLQGEDP